MNKLTTIILIAANTYDQVRELTELASNNIIKDDPEVLECWIYNSLNVADFQEKIEHISKRKDPKLIITLPYLNDGGHQIPYHDSAVKDLFRKYSPQPDISDTIPIIVYNPNHDPLADHSMTTQSNVWFADSFQELGKKIRQVSYEYLFYQHLLRSANEPEDFISVRQMQQTKDWLKKLAMDAAQDNKSYEGVIARWNILQNCIAPSIENGITIKIESRGNIAPTKMLLYVDLLQLQVEITCWLERARLDKHYLDEIDQANTVTQIHLGDKKGRRTFAQDYLTLIEKAVQHYKADVRRLLLYQPLWKSFLRIGWQKNDVLKLLRIVVASSSATFFDDLARDLTPKDPSERGWHLIASDVAQMMQIEAFRARQIEMRAEGRHVRAWLFWVFDSIARYGYKPERLIGTAVIIAFLFSVLYAINDFIALAGFHDTACVSNGLPQSLAGWLGFLESHVFLGFTTIISSASYATPARCGVLEDGLYFCESTIGYFLLGMIVAVVTQNLRRR